MLNPPRRKPGPAPGTPATGHRQPEPYQPGQYTFWSQWQLWPASTRPTNKVMAAALGCHPQTFARKMNPDNRGRGLSPAEMAAGTALLLAL